MSEPKQHNYKITVLETTRHLTTYEVRAEDQEQAEDLIKDELFDSYNVEEDIQNHIEKVVEVYEDEKCTFRTF